MSDRVQIGPQVDEELWQDFREYVRNRHGQVRGSLGDEVERALRNLIYHGSDTTEVDQLAELNDRLQRIESAVGTATADGGATPTTPSEGAGHTHAPSRVQSAADTKPEPNAATEKKVHYLAECILDDVAPTSREFQEVPRTLLVETVKDEYGFRSDTAKRYVSELTDHFDLVAHPNNDALLVTHERRESIRDDERDQQAEASDDRMDDVTDHADYETES